MRFRRSRVGWVFAALYLAVFALAYADYRRYEGTWFADMGLNILVLPYLWVGRIVTLDSTFQLHGYKPWGFVPAVLACGALAYLIGAGIEWALRKFRSLFRNRASGKS
jgi:hypothetical protein